jgi:hypothetical protein
MDRVKVEADQSWCQLRSFAGWHISLSGYSIH